MNVAFILIWIIVIIALIFLGLEVRRNIVTIDGTKNTYIVDLNDFSCYPGNNIENLPQVFNTCCVINGQKTTKQPFTDINNSIRVLVDISPIPGTEACYGFCKNIDVTSGECLDPKNTTNPDLPYNRCITATKVTPGCAAMTLPIARSGDIPYYIVEENVNSNCEVVIKC